MEKESLISIMKKIKKGEKTADNYNTGLIGEQLIVSAYEQMPIDKLEKLRFIMNGIIKKKKEAKRGWNNGAKK
jgi:hypothetical protein